MKALKLKIICLFISLILSYSLDVKDESKFYFCSGRIFVSDNRIGVNQINEICNKIYTDYRILITIQKDIIINGIGPEVENYYTRDSEEFFTRQCNRLNKSICNYGYMVSLYTQARKVRMVAGSISKNQVNLDMRNNIIYSIRNLFSRDMFTEGIIKAVDMIQSYSYNNNPNYIPPNNNPTYIPPSNNNHQKSSNTGIWLFFLFIICPICLCLVYYMYKQTPTSTPTQDSSDQVHVHINKLESILVEIRRKSPPIVSINKCLICVEQISLGNINNINNNFLSTTHNDYYNNNIQSNLINQDPNHTRFSCGHVYHNTCLNNSHLTACVMCVGNVQSSMTIPNTHDYQVVDENNIKNLLRNLHLVYGKDVLQDYAQTYPNEFNSYNSSLALGLAGVWGITAVATTAIVMSEMSHVNNYNDGYHSQYGGYSNNYNYQGNNNYQNYPQNIETDTAEGDF